MTNLLLRFYRSGAEAFFNQFAEIAYPWIFERATKYIRNKPGDRYAIAEEITVLTLCRLFCMPAHQRWSPDRKKPLQHWLSRIIQNLVKDHFRTSARNTRNTNRLLEEAKSGTYLGYSECVDELERAECLTQRDQVLDRLQLTINSFDSLDQKMLGLRFYHDYSYQAIGDTLDIDPQRARRRIIKLLADLRKECADLPVDFLDLYTAP